MRRGLDSGLAKVSRDLDAYYVLTYQPSQATDGRFHPIAVRTARKDAQIRVPSGYWSPLSSEWRTWLDRDKAPRRSSRAGAGAETQPPDRDLVWVRARRRRPDGAGVHLGADRDRQRAAVAPAGRRAQGRRPRRARAVRTEVTRLVGANGETARRDRALVPVPPGACKSICASAAPTASVIDTGAQDVDVPITRGTGPVLLQPQLVRARTAPRVPRAVADPDAAPTPSRVFSRSERLLVRVPAYNPDGAAVSSRSSVSNVKGATIRTLEQVTYDGTAPQFELSLAFLAPGDYGTRGQRHQPHRHRTPTDSLQIDWINADVQSSRQSAALGLPGHADRGRVPVLLPRLAEVRPARRPPGAPAVPDGRRRRDRSGRRPARRHRRGGEPGRLHLQRRDGRRLLPGPLPEGVLPAQNGGELAALYCFVFLYIATRGRR